MAILVTGGAGYIGSHTCVEMQNAGYEIVVVDNLDNSSKESLKRVEAITGKPVKFYEEDVRDKAALRKIFSENSNCLHLLSALMCWTCALLFYSFNPYTSL